MDAEDAVLPVKNAEIAPREPWERDDPELRACDLFLWIEAEDVWPTKEEGGRHPVLVLADVAAERDGVSFADSPIAFGWIVRVGLRQIRRDLGERRWGQVLQCHTSPCAVRWPHLCPIVAVQRDGCQVLPLRTPRPRPAARPHSRDCLAGDAYFGWRARSIASVWTGAT
ncbi:MAG: hypothetical protein LC808_05670 [Actinobacteria bacterium]|nr:hypothetical protein [Actinomycetota bacterium]